MSGKGGVDGRGGGGDGGGGVRGEGGGDGVGGREGGLEGATTIGLLAEDAAAMNTAATAVTKQRSNNSQRR